MLQYYTAMVANVSDATEDNWSSFKAHCCVTVIDDDPEEVHKPKINAKVFCIIQVLLELQPVLAVFVKNTSNSVETGFLGLSGMSARFCPSVTQTLFLVS